MAQALPPAYRYDSYMNVRTIAKLVTSEEVLRPSRKLNANKFWSIGADCPVTEPFFDAGRAKVFPGPNDGKVSVERAKVTGMSDFLVLPATHTFIMNNDEAVSQALYFLRNGRFRRPNPMQPPMNADKRR